MVDDTKSARQQILDLQQQMLVDQVAVAKELAEFVAGEQMSAVVATLQALRDRTIPSTTLDQQISGMGGQLQSLGNVAAQVYQQLSAQLAAK